MNIHIGQEAAAASFPWEALISLAPHLLWAGIILLILRWIGRDGLAGVLKRIQKVSLAGVEIQFQELLEKAVEKRAPAVPIPDLGRATRRLIREAGLLKDARILWIDDQPGNNSLERRLFEAAGAWVDIRISSEDARKALANSSYDLILSDVARGEDKEAGLKFADELASLGSAPPVIFYVGQIRPLPASAFGLTNRPDELVHLVLDALARRRS